VTSGEDPTLLTELRRLAEAGRHREVLARLDVLPAAELEGRTPFALLAAEAHGRLGTFDAAARWAAAALRTARTRGEPQAEMRARNYEGLIALRQGDADAAERHLTSALELARTLGDAMIEARCLNNLGVIANLRGAREEALTNYQLALAAYQQAGWMRGMAETHHNLAISWRELGDTRRALEAAEQAVRLATAVRDDTLVGLTLAGRAAIHLQLTDSSLAAAELDRAAAAYRRVEFEPGLAEVWRLQASVLRLRGDAAGAVALLERAAELAQRSGSADTLADIERDLGSVRAAMGDAVGAQEAWSLAQGRYQRLGAIRAAGEVQMLLTTLPRRVPPP
jgi:tetratricopeptide (TPR) repeat protein